MTSSPLQADQLFLSLPFRGEISEARLAASTDGLKPGRYYFVATESRPNSKKDRGGVLSFLGFSPDARWRQRRWNILSTEQFKRLPDRYLTFLVSTEFQVGK